jgi:hypothetical protein
MLLYVSQASQAWNSKNRACLVQCDHIDDPTGAAPRKPAGVLAAQIRGLLAEMLHVRIVRLQRLRARLQGHAFEWDDAPLMAAVSALHSAARELRFAPLRHGWMARLLGRHRPADARFLAAYEHVAACALQLKAHMLALASMGRESLTATRGALQQLGADLEQFDARIEEGVTWLQEMCTQLADARTQGSDDPQLATLAEAAQLFTQEFKWLQSASTMGQDVALRGNTVLQRRTALLAQLRIDMHMLDETWTPRLARVAAELTAGRNAVRLFPAAIEAHEELMKRLSAALDACGALRHQEPLLAQQLALWQQGLDGRHSDG